MFEHLLEFGSTRYTGGDHEWNVFGMEARRDESSKRLKSQLDHNKK